MNVKFRAAKSTQFSRLHKQGQHSPRFIASEILVKTDSWTGGERLYLKGNIMQSFAIHKRPKIRPKPL